MSADINVTLATVFFIHFQTIHKNCLKTLPLKYFGVKVVLL
jgi:hypothetical protein